MIFVAEDQIPQIPTVITAGGAVVLISTLGTVVGLFVRGTLKTGDRADGLHDAAFKILQNQIDDLRKDVDECETRGEARWQKERQERLSERNRYEDLLTTSERRHQENLEQIRQKHQEDLSRIRQEHQEELQRLLMKDGDSTNPPEK